MRRREFLQSAVIAGVLQEPFGRYLWAHDHAQQSPCGLTYASPAEAIWANAA